VLFADLVGFTTLSESIDPEQAKNLVDRCFEQLVAVVRSFGGQVDKIVGDAIVALFGAPVAHEDDPERAVRAAIRMLELIREIGPEAGTPVELRIGVNTGEVVVGALRSGGEYTAMGDTVNVASRLQTLAEPGQVLVGPLTYEATRHAICYEAAGARRVKGRDAAVPTWAAVAAATLPGGHGRRPHVPLVGRDAELALAREALSISVMRNRAHLFLLAGEAGMGKHRLASEIATGARAEHGALVARGHGVPYGAPTAWWPLAEALRDLCGVQPDDDETLARDHVVEAAAAALAIDSEDSRAGQLAHGLLEFTGLVPWTPAADPDRAREQALAATTAFLRAMAREQPLLMVLTGMQWADDPLLELCDELVIRLADSRFTLLLTTRPELRERWIPARGRHLHIELGLDPLDLASTRRLAELFLDREITDELAFDLYERSGGNPFFLEELSALWAESPKEEERGVPATLNGLVGARLDALIPATRVALEDAAVVGARGSVESLVALADARRPASAPPALDDLVARDLLVLADGDYAFTSDVVREVAYGRMTKAERARRHAVLATWMDEHAADAARPGEVRDTAAHHHGVAGELALELGSVPGAPADLPARGFRALVGAADRAASAELWVSAERSLDRAERLGPRDGETRQRLLLARAEARTNRRRLSAAHRDVDEVLADPGDPALHALALTRRGDIELREGGLEAAAATLEASVALWHELGDEGSLAHAFRLRGLVEVYRGRLDAARPWVEQALESFRSVGDEGGAAWALESLALTAFLQGNMVLAGERLDESIAAFEAIDDWGGLIWARGLQAWVRFGEGRLDKAEELATRVRAHDPGSGDRGGAGLTELLLGNLQLWRGHPGPARARVLDAIDLLEETGDRWGEMQARLVLARVQWAAGDAEAALRSLDQATELERALRGPDGTSAATTVRALILAELGRVEDALELLRRIEAEEPSHPGAAIAGTEQVQAKALALAMHDDADQAVILVRAALRESDGEGRRRALGAALALALAATGRRGDTRTALDAIPNPERGTYQDRMMSAIVRAALDTAEGNERGADAALDGARHAAGEAPLANALVQLAATTIRGTTQPGPVGESAAGLALSRFGVDAEPWARLFAAAAGRSAR